MAEDGQTAERDAVADAMDACVRHARDLVTAAKAVLASGQHNIAFHLATLALEEVGRRALIAVQDISSKATVPPAWPRKHEQDHVKKLFWCFFDAMFEDGRITKERLESAEALSRNIHLDRLAGLYVSAGEDGLHLPREAITPEQAQNLVDLAEARVNMAAAMKRRENIPQDEIDQQAWFLAITENPDQRKLVLSGASMAKLAELGTVVAWGKWLREQFSKAEADGRAMLQRELERSQNLPAAKTKDKWRLRIRIYSGSHSIRPGVLTKWNEKSDWIKLSAVQGKNNQLLVDFILGDNVPIESLWFFGWGLARSFVMALNIGTMGYWWWRLPEFVSRYHESLCDLENDSDFDIKRNPSLEQNWGENRVLKEQDLGRVAMCMAALPRPGENDRLTPFNFYTGGITFLSLNDIHWQCELQAYGNFHECLKAMMKASGEWNEGQDYVEAFLRFYDDAFPNTPERERFKVLCTAFETKSFDGITVELNEAVAMKLFCDQYFLRKVGPEELRRTGRTPAEA